MRSGDVVYMYAVQETCMTAGDNPANTLELLYAGQNDLYVSVKQAYGPDSEEAARQQRVVAVIEDFCKIRSNTYADNAAAILDAFTGGSLDSQTLAADLAVHYVCYDIVPLPQAVRALKTLLASENPVVVAAASNAVVFLREFTQTGGDDELTRRCLYSDGADTAHIQLDLSHLLLHVVPE